MARNPDPNEWHGHHIISEDEFDSPEFAVDAEAKRRRTVRHGIILTLVVMLLAAALVTAYLVNTKAIVIDALEPKPVAAAPSEANASCPKDELAYVQPSKMKINVMNGTEVAGLAGATATKLKKRGFKVGDVGNARLSQVDVVGAVTSGPDGYAQAMTLQRNITGLAYVFDPKRQGSTVDLVIGTKYKDLVNEKKINSKSGKLGCTPVKAKTAPAKPEPSKTPQGSGKG